MEGISGCEYLAEGVLAKASYVFGPLAQNLRHVGYEDEVNLSAVPVTITKISLVLYYFVT